MLTDLEPLDLLLLILAAFRLTHLVVADSITEPLRRFFIGQAPAAPGRADAAGARRNPMAATLITCFWCAGIWVATGLVLALWYGWGPVRLLVLILAVAGGQAFLEALIRRP